MMWEAGLFNSMIGEIVAIVAVVLSNINMLRCLRYMPASLTGPDSNLTYGSVVHFIMDARYERISRIIRKIGFGLGGGKWKIKQGPNRGKRVF